jgi:hypothetical protein
MKPIHVLLATAIALIITCYIAGSAISQNKTSASTLPANFGGNHGESNPARDELLALKQNLAKLQSELSNVHTALDALSGQMGLMTDNATPTGVATLTVSPQNRADKSINIDARTSKKLQEARLQAIETTLSSEETDKTWAASASDTIQRAVQEADNGANELLALDCRSTLCRVEVSHQTPMARADFMQRFALKVGTVLPTMTIEPVSMENGHSVSRIYLARTGHELPALTPQRSGPGTATSRTF